MAKKFVAKHSSPEALPSDDEHFQAGFHAGWKWAEELATRQQLERIEAIVQSGDWPGLLTGEPMAPLTWTEWFISAVAPEDEGNITWWELTHLVDVPTDEREFIRGFIEGAMGWRYSEEDAE